MKKIIITSVIILTVSVVGYLYYYLPSQVVIPENSLIFQVYAHQSGKPVATLSDREKINQFTGLLSSINDNWVKPGDAFPSAHTTILIYRKDRKKGDIFWLGDGWIGVPGNTGPQLTYLENDSYQKIRTMLNITAAR